MRKRSLILAGAAILLLMTFRTSGAASVTVPAADTISVDDTSYNLISEPDDYTGLMWENTGTTEVPVYKACLCMMSAFRALQALGIYLGIDNFTTANIQITTGWSTDGPEELFVDNLGWVKGTNFSYADPITPGSHLTLADAWYQFTVGAAVYRVSLTADNYQFDHDIGHQGYHADWDFFDYRTYFQTTSDMDQTKIYFRDVVRPEIVENLKGATFFEVNPVPLPGAVWLLGTGLVGLIGLGRRRSPRRS